jgi:hypothetical protein
MTLKSVRNEVIYGPRNKTRKPVFDCFDTENYRMVILNLLRPVETIIHPTSKQIFDKISSDYGN